MVIHKTNVPWRHSKCYNVHNCQIPKLTRRVFFTISDHKALFTSNVFSPCPLFTPLLLPPTNKVAGQGNVFTPVCHSVHRRKGSSVKGGSLSGGISVHGVLCQRQSLSRWADFSGCRPPLGWGSSLSRGQSLSKVELPA